MLAALVAQRIVFAADRLDDLVAIRAEFLELRAAQIQLAVEPEHARPQAFAAHDRAHGTIDEDEIARLQAADTESGPSASRPLLSDSSKRFWIFAISGFGAAAGAAARRRRGRCGRRLARRGRRRGRREPAPAQGRRRNDRRWLRRGGAGGGNVGFGPGTSTGTRSAADAARAWVPDAARLSVGSGFWRLGRLVLDAHQHVLVEAVLAARRRPRRRRGSSPRSSRAIPAAR